MKKKNFVIVILLSVFMLVFAGCSDGDLTNQIVKDNISDLYLVVLDKNDSLNIEIENLPVSHNQFDSQYGERKHKLILISEKFAKDIDLEKITEIKNLILADGYWVLFPCIDKDEVVDFARKFGKSINSVESNYIMGYSIIYNYTQGIIQGIPHYTSKITALDSDVYNSLIKQSFRDMIEKRFEDKP